jgi:hypothetical protein
MKKFLTNALILVVLFLALRACLFEAADSGTTSTSEPNWSNYTPELKERILNSDCSELQREFDTAADNSDRQRARTGEGNLDLMNYIDERLKMKGCY